MAILGDQKLNIVISTKSDLKGLKSIDRQLKKTSANVEKMSGTMKALRSSFRALLSFAAVAGFVGVMRGLSGAMKNAALAAGDAVEIQNRFNAVFGETGDVANEFATDLALAVGRSTTEIKESLSSLQSFAVGMGLSKEAAFEMSTELQKLVIDFASFNNLADADAARIFLAGISGEAEAFKRFGVNLQEANVSMKVMELGLVENAKNASQLDKAIARLKIIEEVMGKQGAIGDAIETADSFNNKMKAATAIVDEFREVFGKSFVDAIGNAEKFKDTIIVVAAASFQALSLVAEGAIKVARGIAAVVALNKNMEAIVSISTVAKSRLEGQKILREQEEQLKSLSITEETRGRILNKIRQQQIKRDQELLAEGTGGGILAALKALDDGLDESQERLKSFADEMLNIDESAIRARVAFKGFDAEAIKAGASVEKLGKDAGKASKELEKQEKIMAGLTKQVIKFKERAVESGEKITKSFERQKESLAKLEAEYAKVITGIQRRLSGLDRQFGRSEVSARESFLGQLASAVSTAEDTIKAREELIETELGKGDEADMEKVAKLKSLNKKELDILKSNESLVSEARKKEEESRTAVGVQNLINRFNREREEAKKRFDEEKDELRQQLAEKEVQFRESSERIKNETKELLADVRKQYLKLFDDLFSDLKEHDAIKLFQSIGLAEISMAAKTSFNTLLSKATPKFDVGGTVPGPIGSPQLIIAHGGETVLPTHRDPSIGTQNITFDITVRDNNDLQALLRKVEEHLGQKSLARQFGVS